MTKRKKITIFILMFFLAGFIVPERIKIPVSGATVKDWNHRSFWFEPWRTSGVHKGIDIFAATGSSVISTTDGIVLSTANISKGGNIIVILGPKWRFHYYAHLHTIDAEIFSFVRSGKTIGTVGNSGNAKGKPSHLHYSIVRLFPVPWTIDDSTQGYKKAFFIDPSLYLLDRF